GTCAGRRRWDHVAMAAPPYTRGLHEVGDGVFAWLQPDGSWGWSNAGLVVDGEASLLVDTLYDLRTTGEMLDAMRRATPAAATIDTLVNRSGEHTSELQSRENLVC